MNRSPFERSWFGLGVSAGRRDLLRTLAALGTTLLAALGLTAQGAAAKHGGNGGQRRKHPVDKQKPGGGLANGADPATFSAPVDSAAVSTANEEGQVSATKHGGKGHHKKKKKC